VPDFVLTHTQKWLDHFTQQGYRASPLAAGVEGAIYDLGGDLIAKVWRARRTGELRLMQHFYTDVAKARLPFKTPEILTIEQVDGVSVTYERKLSGRPLQQRLSVHDRSAEPAAARCVIDVLQALSTVPATEAMRRIPVLDEEQPLWTGADTFRDALTNLLSRRVARFGYVIRTHLGDFDRRYASLQKRLAVLASYPATVIHGDLVPGNILVDKQARPVAVLDFGFLTTAGDPRLDAAIAASVMNMYGSYAPAITDALTAQVAQDLDYPVDVLLTYQAAYAVATANAFTSDGSDGHFAWCIDRLRRSDVADALGM
jgi:aminoglycoside phosphotransferase (APT) family kinase protein